MISFAQQIAVVTGASSGVGRALATQLIAAEATVCGVGRRLDALRAVDPGIRPFTADLTDDRELEDLGAQLQRSCARIDLLIHCAGEISLGPMEEAPVEVLDRLYRLNLRAPYRLTQLLLPQLKQTRGQLVFINSSVVQQAKPGLAPYTATKAALKAMADCIRAEVNDAGIRVLSVFPGKTATPMQERIHESAGRDYQPATFIQPEDVAASVLAALSLPRTAEITDILLRPMSKPSS